MTETKKPTTEEWTSMAWEGHIELMKEALNHMTAEEINAKNAFGQTALYCATRKGYQEIVELLLRAPNIDVNSQEKNGSTALHAASFVPRERILSLLLTFGCDQSINNFKGQSAYTEAQKEALIVWKLWNSGGVKALKQAGYPIWTEPTGNKIIRTLSSDRVNKRKIRTSQAKNKTFLKSNKTVVQADVKEMMTRLDTLYQQAISSANSVIQGTADEAKLFDVYSQALEAIAKLSKSSSNMLINSSESQTYKYNSLTYFLPAQKEDLPPLIDHEKPTQFVIEPNCKVFNPSNYRLNIVPDIYARDFMETDHLKYIRCTPGDKKEKFIIIVAVASIYDLHRGLEISKKGYKEFVVPVKKGDVPMDKTIRRVTRWLHNRYKEDEIVYVPDDDYSLNKDVQKIEINSPQIKTELKIGIIYALSGQINPHEMLKNTNSPSFTNFLSAINIDPKQSSEKWNDILVHWYVSPFLNADQHRRDVGNAPCIIFFQDEGKPFDASQVQELGMVPQIFVVIQPFWKNMGYRVGFFRSGNLHAFEPMVPANHIFLKDTLKNFLLTKIYNGNVTFCYCSPMNRGFVLTRESDISQIADKYLDDKK